MPAAQLHLATRYILQEKVNALRASGVRVSAGASMRTSPNSVIQKSHPHLIVKGTNQEQEVQRPTLTCAAHRISNPPFGMHQVALTRRGALAGALTAAFAFTVVPRCEHVWSLLSECCAGCGLTRLQFENTRGQPPARGWGTVLEQTPRHSARCPL